LIITKQEIPPDRYPQPQVPFLTHWGLEFLITGLYGICGTGILLGTVRKKSRLFLIFPGVLVTTAGVILHNNGILMTYTLLVLGVIMTAVGILLFVRQSRGVEKHEPASK
jgi:hypothetical protein